MSGDRVPVTLAEAVEDRTDSTVDQLLELLAIDTANPPGETTTIVDAVESRFESFGIETERVLTDPAKPNLLARIPGASDSTLLYNGHFDTVPYDPSAWEHDPLGERSEDRIYGRGATDMKGALAAMLSVAEAYAETGTVPPVTLQFAFVSDEEIAGEPGLPTLLDSGRIDADWCVIGETTCENGRHSVTVADKGSVWLTLAADGTAAHGSRPVLGENAIDRLYDAVERIRSEFGTVRFDMQPEIEDIVTESVEYYAPSMGEAAARDLFEYPTINLGTIEGGESVNSVPASATARLDIRLTAGVQTRDVLRKIRDCAADCAGIHIEDVSWSVGTYEPLDSPLVTAVTEAARAVTDDRVYRRSATGGGDAKTLRNAGIPTVEFGIGTDTVHGVDEYTTVDALRANALVYASLPYWLAADRGARGP
ncbi:acetylornithine deacetylase [Halorientalis sp. IM1011]|uniref:M20 family metallopeptidase n=1 Tax=Halorientalis sp. IM1011 TaxID=1932360 RepID=UPI00097CD631|nr:M20/M25/M40 family metallo-hydrolase [Halorientalis sp. IM1011]AQL44320.1 acetylornithine deacetylase [Halorientalis sp. IM1011]